MHMFPFPFQAVLLQGELLFLVVTFGFAFLVLDMLVDQKVLSCASA